MRLMYVLPAEAFGGAERQGVMHIRRLADFGFEIEAVVGPGDPVRRALQSYNFKSYHYCATFPVDTHSKMGFVGNLRFGADYVRAFFGSSNALIKIGGATGCDLVFAGRSFGWAVAARAAHELGLPYIVRAGSRPTRLAQVLAVRAMCARYGQPAALLANCQSVYDSLKDAFTCPGGIVPNGVDTDRFDPASVGVAPLQSVLGRALAAGVVGSGSRPIVGLAARPSPGKGIDLFVEVVSLCARSVDDVLFLVAGEFGWRRYYQDLMQERGLAENVRFLGHIDSMPSFYASCDVVILTSPARSIEGSPNALLEAMSMARPVVASKVGGIPEIIRDGVEGYLVEPTDAPVFTERIQRLLGDEKLRTTMARAGRARILDRYSEQAAMQTLVNALRQYGPG